MPATPPSTPSSLRRIALRPAPAGLLLGIGAVVVFALGYRWWHLVGVF